VKSLLTTSDGVHVPNPRHLAHSANRVAAAQRDLSRCRQGSTRRQRANAQVARLHCKVRRQRLDHAHKVALDLVRRHDVICHEALRIGNMSRSARGTMTEPGRNVCRKSSLNRSILDAGWGVFLRILASRAESADRELIAVDPRNTSITCPDCGHAVAENRVTQAKFQCVRCAHEAHADVVGALNVLRTGLVRRDAATAA
jgi:putative transposase